MIKEDLKVNDDERLYKSTPEAAKRTDHNEGNLKETWIYNLNLTTVF